MPKHEIVEWTETNEINRVLVIFAHQDDELLVAGTLAGLDAAGAETMLLTLTNGDGSVNPGQSTEDRIAERAANLNDIANILQVDRVEQGFFSEGVFMDSDDEIKQVILEKINDYQPDTIITWDTVKGLYGHPHHIRVGQLVVEVCEENGENTEFPVEAVYGSTVSVWLREILKQISPMYQKGYYRVNDEESIEPEFSIATSDFGDSRRDSFAVYAAEGAVQGLNPLSGYPTLENFVFDREYFYQSY
ncbi:MAG: PIG-L family deacetylase [Anaerolineae bacterium]|nr:PIG-L family deacetylase [Anaerolineae bacterium]